jgi:hypothetical protein
VKPDGWHADACSHTVTSHAPYSATRGYVAATGELQPVKHGGLPRGVEVGGCSPRPTGSLPALFGEMRTAA